MLVVLESRPPVFFPVSSSVLILLNLIRTKEMLYLTFASIAVGCLGYKIPVVRLGNAAAPNMTMPMTGLGTGGYGHSSTPSPSSYPECWSDDAGCGPWVRNATATYLKLSASISPSTQIRIDNANTYNDVDNVGIGMVDSRVPRSDIFLLSKTGSGQAMGFEDTLDQFDALLAAGGYSYVDALLIHWPTSSAPSKEPSCVTGAPTYDAKACRLATWRAYVTIFKSGRALAIGVSNYNSTHLQEIMDAGLPLPSINQIPYNLYRSSSWTDTVAWCLRNGVTVNSYSPFGVPDAHQYPTSSGMSATLLQDPVLADIAQAHGRLPAEILSAWFAALGIPFNPRTYQETVGAHASARPSPPPARCTHK